MKKKFLLFFTFLGALLIWSCQDNTPPTIKSTLQDTVKKENNLPKDDTLPKDNEENKSRVIWQKPDMVIQLLGDIKDKTIADIGAGTGFFSFRLVPKAKKVIAIDIDPRLIRFMDSTRSELPKELQSHFEARLVQPNDPNLKSNEADAVIIVNTYMYIQNREAYLRVLKKGIVKGGKVLIIDYKEKNMPIGPATKSKVALATVEKELKKAGFVDINSDDTSLDYQYIITAKNE